MLHSSVQDQIENLDARLRRVESVVETPKKGMLSKAHSSYKQKSDEQRSRMGGWFIIILSTLGLLNGQVNIPVVTGLFGFTLILGFWLLVRSSGVFEMSESTEKLFLEHRAKKASAAHSLHGKPSVHKGEKPEDFFSHMVRFAFLIMGGIVLGLVLSWLLNQYVTDALSRLLPLLVVMLGCLYYAIAKDTKWLLYIASIGLYSLLLLSDLPLYSLSIILVLTPILVFAGWKRNDLVYPGVLAVLAYGSLIRWLYAFVQPGNYPKLINLDQWTNERYVIFASILIFFIVLVAPFFARRRAIEDRDAARFVMVTSTIGYLFTFGWLNEYLGMYRWFVALFSLVILLACFAYLSWVRYQRFSYAKYFLGLAVGCAIVFAYTYLDSVAVTLLWFMISVVLLTVGFLMNSYTARISGLLLLSLTGLQYMLVILPNPEQYAGPVWLHERVWLGIILSIYLPILALWFKDAKLQATESKLVPVYISSFFSASFFFLFAIIFFEGGDVWQTLLWLILAFAGIAVGAMQRIPVLRTLGLSLLFIAVIKLFLVDALTFSMVWQVITLSLFGVLLVSGGLAAHKYQRVFRRYFS
jgi:hypothetical protein